jgi:hypothetical protein
MYDVILEKANNRIIMNRNFSMIYTNDGSIMSPYECRFWGTKQ